MNPVLKVYLKPGDDESEPNGEKIFISVASSQIAAQTGNLYAFFFLLLGEGAVESEVVGELLVIIFYLHSLWLSLSRLSLLSGVIFSFPFLPSRHHHIETFISDSSVSGCFPMFRFRGHDDSSGNDGMGKLVMRPTLEPCGSPTLLSFSFIL